MDIALHCSWSFSKDSNGEYFVAYTHWIYIDFIAKHFQKVYIISPVKNVEQVQDQNSVSCFKNVEMIPIPNYKGMLDAQKYFYHYCKAIKSVVNKVHLFYCRVPGPFSWMPRLLFRKKCIMHYVGDSIDATLNNEKWSFLRKLIMLLCYTPDFLMTLLASKNSTVYTNGNHLSNKLFKYGIKAIPVVSSTLSKSSIPKLLPITGIEKKERVSMCYLGYIRNAKGIRTLMELWIKLKRENIDFLFNVIGYGEMYEEMEQFVDLNNLKDNILLWGHIDERGKINDILRSSDLFIFPSLSEGSPRVILEAMASGIPVISTPVGSLPSTFKDKETIRFFDFNDANAVMRIIGEYMVDPSPFIAMRTAAYNEVKEKYTIEKFLSTVFNI